MNDEQRKLSSLLSFPFSLFPFPSSLFPFFVDNPSFSCCDKVHSKVRLLQSIMAYRILQ